MAKAEKKSGPGRPRLGNGKRGGESPLIGLRLPPSELAKVDSLATHEGLKRSEMVRRLMLAGIAVYRPGKPPK